MLTKPSGSHEQGLGASVVSFQSEQIPPKRAIHRFPGMSWIVRYLERKVHVLAK